MSAVDILSNVDKYQIIASYPVSEANIQENLISKNYKNVDQSVSLAAKGIVNVNFHPSLCFLVFFLGIAAALSVLLVCQPRELEM